MAGPDTAYSLHSPPGIDAGLREPGQRPTPTTRTPTA
jgi:hypothetical protein